MSGRACSNNYFAKFASFDVRSLPPLPIKFTDCTGGPKWKRKNFLSEKEEQCCKSFMYVSTDTQWGFEQTKKLHYGWLLLHIMQETSLQRVQIDLWGVSKWSGVIWRLALPSFWATMSKSKPSTKVGEHTTTTSLLLCSSLKHCWLLLQDHPHFVAIFRPMGLKWKVASSKAPDLPVNGREANFAELQPQHWGVDDNVNLHMPLGRKSTKLDDKDMRVKETALRANARATPKFTQTTLKLSRSLNKMFLAFSLWRIL